MGKRSNFERKERDFYETPIEATLPLIPHLGYDFTFIEPCAGAGVLIDNLEDNGGKCNFASDIVPQRGDIHMRDYAEIDTKNVLETDYIITNPPWNRILLHPMIEHFSSLCPTWLLFDADWIHTKQSIPYISKLHKIVSVGRVRWFGNTTGKDNCAWYLFCKKPAKEIKFYGRI
jgi:hypothetical protein